MSDENSPKTRVLLVDDDVTLLDMYKERLQMAGYEVITASNGEEALGKATETLPHVILLDVMMPKINGFDALNILKSTTETKDIPVIILTALTQDNHRQKGMADGASDYVVKSEAMPKEVVEKIEKVVAARKKQLEQSAA
ncbi:MAG: response regulator [Bacteroidales bacterium]|nr:response regulator [Bacteroidales bacterium]